MTENTCTNELSLLCAGARSGRVAVAACGADGEALARLDAAHSSAAQVLLIVSVTNRSHRLGHLITTAEGREKNRRVEWVITDRAGRYASSAAAGPTG